MTTGAPSRRVLHGRDAERAAIGELLDAARASRGGALIVRGEPGIGKTALLEDAVERAADMHVLTARGAETESELPFAALHQLFRHSLDHVEQLPAPQAAALRGALGLENGRGDERFLIFAACLSLLSALAERRPALCLVDDAHWLDAGSAEALAFVARRLDAECISILFAAREGDVRRFEPRGIPSLALGGLGAEAAATILAEGGGARSSPTVRDRLLELTAGNALALLELPSALTEAQLAGEAPLPDALPLTQRVEEVFLERTRRLSGDAQTLLLVAASDDTGALAVVTRAAAALGLDEDALTEAERTGLLIVQGARVGFHHPLVRSAVYAGATSTQRRAAHLALADALVDADEHLDRRAWHLAAASVGPDGGAVRALEDAAARAEARGAYTAAGRALERAAELASDPERGPFLARAAWATCLAGRNDHAVALAHQAAPDVHEPLLRARLAEVRGLAAIRGGRPHDVVPQLVEVAREVSVDEPATALELVLLAGSATWPSGDGDAYVEIARIAQQVTVPPGDERSTFNRRALDGFAAMIEGNASAGARLLADVVERGLRTEEAVIAYRASWAAMWLGDDERFRRLVGRANQLGRAGGDVGTLAQVLGYSAAHLALGQRYDDALIAATEAVELARELNAVNLELYPRAVIAIVAAVRGDDQAAQRQGEETLAVATANGVLLFGGSHAVHGLALLDLGRARWTEALERLDSIIGRDGGAQDPVVAAMYPDAIEAAMRAGRPERAHAVLDLFARYARYASAALQPRLASCRALVAGGQDAGHHFEVAMRSIDEARPFDRGRILLLHGEHLRRERRRVDARPPLRAAIEQFERIGAEPWAERARRELRASGETTRKRDPSAIDGLTPQELQIARLVAEGLTNKEVAAQLFLSPRTIDHHMRNVFAKLGVTSRTQLGRVPLGDDGSLPRADTLASA